MAHHLRTNPESYLRAWRFFKEPAGIGLSGENARPWMNEPVVDFLDQRVNSEMRVFEYGSGASTLFFAARAKEVIAAEHNPQWRESVSQHLPDNAHVVVAPAEPAREYAAAICEADGLFQLILIDGEHRMECVNPAIEKLSSDGVVLVDDCETKHTVGVPEAILERGFRFIPFVGLKRGSIKRQETRVFYRDGNCLGI